jgi:hypothetical protein
MMILINAKMNWMMEVALLSNTSDLGSPKTARFSKVRDLDVLEIRPLVGRVRDFHLVPCPRLAYNQ